MPTSPAEQQFPFAADPADPAKQSAAGSVSLSPPRSSIMARQLTAEMITLQRAVAVAHRRAKLVAATRAWVVVLLAALGLAAVSFPTLAVSVAVVGFFSALLLGVTSPLVHNMRRKAVVLQEEFDTAVFELPWNEGLAGERSDEAHVQQLARKLRAGSRRDRAIREGWYDDTTGIPYPFDVLVCQAQSLGWDLRLRRRFEIVLVS